MKTPFLFLVCALSCGILSGDFFTLTTLTCIIILSTLLVFALMYQKITLHQTLFKTSVLVAFCFTLGVSLRNMQLTERLNLVKECKQGKGVRIVLTEYKGVKGKSALWKGCVIQHTPLFHSSLQLQLYLDTLQNFHKNDILLLPFSGNSWEFCDSISNDWMLRSDISARVFVKQFIKSNKPYLPNQLVQWSEALQSYTLHVIYTHLHDRNAAAIAISMILGLRTEIEPALQNAYKNTGTVHILAVSGMHVALLHQALIFLTAFSGNYRKIKISRNILSLCLLWFYALLTGFTASVIRAAAMFSLVLIASTLEKKDKGLNNLCAASFVLLCYDTTLLYDYGFLLSVSAVSGIFLFNPERTHEQIAWKKFFREGAGISIAAQAGTLPISLYLSRSFPLYFLPANLILVPLSSLALYLGLSLLVFHYIPVLNTVNAYLLEYALIIMNKIVLFLSALPGGTLDAYFFDQPCAWWTAIILYFLALFLQQNRKVYFFAFLSLSVFFLGWINRQEYTDTGKTFLLKAYYQQQPVVLYLKGRTLHVQYAGTVAPPYYWLAKKANLPDGLIARVNMISVTIPP